MQKGGLIVLHLFQGEGMRTCDVADLMGVSHWKTADRAMTLLQAAMPGAIKRDRQMSLYRRDLNWNGMLSEAIDPDWARERVRLSSDGETCTMCGELCAVKLSRRSAKGSKST